MAESVVDALEVIEIEAMHGEALAVPAHPPQQFIQPLIEQDAVWQIGQRIVMRHIGDTRFGLLALGDVDDRNQYRMRFAKRNAARIGQDFDLAAVGLDVTPGPVGLVGVADRSRDLAMDIPFVARPQIEERHAVQLRAAIAVMDKRRVIDADDAQIGRIVEPHRHRIAVEQQTKRCLALLEIADIGERHR